MIWKKTVHFLQYDKSDITLEKAMVDADVFVGLSVGNTVTPEMVKSMAKRPIVFAMANPDPEITYDAATAVREDLIMATGRSDFPNQVNNVLGFPFIFRGALDVRATQINEAMKLAAVHALADLAKTPVPDIVNMAYNEKNISFGPRYIVGPRRRRRRRHHRRHWPARHRARRGCRPHRRRPRCVPKTRVPYPP